MKTTRYFCLCAIVFLCGFLETNPKQGAFYSCVKNHHDQKEIVIRADRILGQYSTFYVSSPKVRKHNIKNAAAKISGTVVYPGETFSILNRLIPFTAENGYKVSKAFANGKVVDSIGGGVCQVATTLYNAVLDAELEVVERHPHSMTVSYVPLGRDAAIAENIKDFRFKNNFDTPVIIEAYTKNNCQVSFRIKGVIKKDTNRSCSFESIVLEEIKPGPPVIEYDKTKALGYEKITQTARSGYRVEVYKVISYAGKVVERKKISYSEYKPALERITLGNRK